MSQLIGDQFELTVYCSTKSYKKKIKKYNKANIEYVWFKATGVQSIPYDILSIILSSARNTDVLLVLGSSGAIVLPLVSFFTSKKIIFNMAGLEWKRSKWNVFARYFLKLSEKIAIKYSDAVVVDNQGLQEYIMEEYGAKSRVIPYGGDQVSQLVMTDEMLLSFPFLRYTYFSAVARVQHDNNVHIILEAFEKIPEKHLVFVGNWGFSEYGRVLKEKYKFCANIHMLDPIYDLLRLDQIRTNCVAYIHGHSAGGTNPSLVEAMHLELPIIAFDVNFNRYTTQNQATYFVNSNELEKEVNDFDAEIQKANASAMKTIATDIYTWRHVIREYEKLF